MFIELAMHMDTFMYVYDVSNIIQPAAWVHIHKMRLSLYIALLFCECVGLTIVQICRVEPKEDWSRLTTCGHMICHLQMNHMTFILEFCILAVNPRNSSERNSIQIDVASLNLDYFLFVRVRDYSRTQQLCRGLCSDFSTLGERPSSRRWNLAASHLIWKWSFRWDRPSRVHPGFCLRMETAVLCSRLGRKLLTTSGVHKTESDLDT